MRIYNEDISRSYEERFDPRFLAKLEEQDYTLEEIINMVSSTIHSLEDEYPGIIAAEEYSATIDKEVADAIIERLLEIEDTVIADPETEEYDISGIIDNYFWEDSSFIDEVEQNNEWAAERRYEEGKAEIQALERDYWNSRM